MTTTTTTTTGRTDRRTASVRAFVRAARVARTTGHDERADALAALARATAGDRPTTDYGDRLAAAGVPTTYYARATR